MKHRKLTPLLLLFALLPLLAQQKNPGLYASFETSIGSFVCELFEKQTPLTVASFVGLAEGTKEWLTDKGENVKRPFFNGMIFHRVIKGFAIQAGDATRAGNFPHIVPFDDEIIRSLRFDAPGVLAMANNGPNTNRTQFFITVAAQPHLNGKHTIFGRVIEGLEVVKQISEVRTIAGRPAQDVVIRKVTIRRSR